VDRSATDAVVFHAVQSRLLEDDDLSDASRFPCRRPRKPTADPLFGCRARRVSAAMWGNPRVLPTSPLDLAVSLLIPFVQPCRHELSEVVQPLPGCPQDPPQSGGGRDLRLRPRAHEHRSRKKCLHWMRRGDRLSDWDRQSSLFLTGRAKPRLKYLCLPCWRRSHEQLSPSAPRAVPRFLATTSPAATFGVSRGWSPIPTPTAWRFRS
jgi:hypothetical protein